MRLRLRRLARLLPLGAVALGGCFSADDFSACTEVGAPCGQGLVCTAPGRCAPQPPGEDGAVSADRREPDAGGRAPLEIINEIPPFIDAEGRDVRLLTGRLAGAGVRMVVGARTIEITQALDVSGLGNPGGGGGGGGGGGTRMGMTAAGEGGSASAAAGNPGSEVGPGDGGQGSPGRPGNAPGGPGGAADQVDGQPGADGVFGATCDEVSVTLAVPGNGGGGGGGGRGAAALAAQCTGPGGGGGGVGGAGGGILVFEASERIVVQGVLKARGAVAPDDGGAPGGAACEACGACAPEAGRGGDGNGTGGPGPGSEGAGGGGRGGDGSGGMILLQAPTITFAANAALDVAGAGEAGGGLIALYGEVLGDPLLAGYDPALFCRTATP